MSSKRRKSITQLTKQSLPWEASRSAANQDSPRILWNPKVHYRIHNSPPPVPVLSQISRFHVLQPIYLKCIVILSSHLRLGLPNGFFSSCNPNTTLYAPLPAPPPHTCHVPRPSHSSCFDLAIIFGEEHHREATHCAVPLAVCCLVPVSLLCYSL